MTDRLFRILRELALQNFRADCFEWNAGGDVQTVFNFAGTGTTKFSGGLFETIYFLGRGVNSGHKFHWS